MTNRSQLSQRPLFTVGHSTADLGRFLRLIATRQVTVIADVRSRPFSSHAPQFNKEALKAELRRSAIRYVYLGDQLGARPSDRSLYIDGRVDFRLLYETQSFRDGIARVIDGWKQYSLALMCTEKDPITCHRAILVCRHLRSQVSPIEHILQDGSLESHEHMEQRLLAGLRLTEPDLFMSDNEALERAYDLQAARIAACECDDIG